MPFPRSGYRRPNPFLIGLATTLDELGNRLIARQEERTRKKQEDEEAKKVQREQAANLGSVAAQRAASAGSLPELAGIEAGFQASPLRAMVQDPGAFKRAAETSRQRLTAQDQQAIFEQARGLIGGGETLTGALERVGQRPAGEAAPGQVQLSQPQIGRLAQAQGLREAQQNKANTALAAQAVMGGVGDIGSYGSADDAIRLAEASLGGQALPDAWKGFVRSAHANAVAAAQGAFKTTDVIQIADQYRRDTADEQEIFNRYASSVEAMKRPGPGSDLLIVNNTVRMMDPGNRVTDSEFDNALRGLPISDQTRLILRRAFAGILDDSTARLVDDKIVNELVGAQKVIKDQTVKSLNAKRDQLVNVARMANVPDIEGILPRYDQLFISEEFSDQKGPAAPGPRQEPSPQQAGETRQFTDAELRDIQQRGSRDEIQQLQKLFPLDWARYAQLFPGGR